VLCLLRAAFKRFCRCTPLLYAVGPNLSSGHFENQQFPRGNAKKGVTAMPIQKRTVSGAGKSAEKKQSKAEASPLKANPLTANTMMLRRKKESFNATTMMKARS